MTENVRIATDDDLRWLDTEPDPADIAQSLQASATAALQATRLPAGYVPVRVSVAEDS